MTPLDAFAVARVPVPDPGHPRVTYLVEDSPWGLDLRLAVEWNGTVVSRPNFSDMSYSCAQQLAHMTVNGATVRPGDLFASGTVSGPEVDQRGCFLELSWGGREKITLADGVDPDVPRGRRHGGDHRDRAGRGRLGGRHRRGGGHGPAGRGAGG